MEYIPGPTLQDLEADFPWPLERWWPFALGLMNAIEALEQKQLLHRDIKPANIILHEADGRPVLVDFGFAVQLGYEHHTAGTPLFLPPEAFGSSQPPQSCDRYALGIVLLQVLTGYLPFTITDAQQRIVHIPPQVKDEKIRRVASVLLRLVSNDPIERPVSVPAIRSELQTAMLAVEDPVEISKLEDKMNPWVDNIRSLYRNSDIGNANNRGLDSDFVKETYIPTALDEQLLPALFRIRPKVIFLSGNPGDGKTAFLEKVKLELENRQSEPGPQDNSGWEWRYDGHIFRSCYDASEAHAGLSADDQLTEKLQGLEGDNRPDFPITVLVAINDGRLSDYFTRNYNRFVWLSRQINNARQVSEIETSEVWLVDLKRRAFVDLPENEGSSVFRRVLERLVDAEHWKICEDCAAKTICPMRNNAIALRKGRGIQRLEYLLLLIHLRRQRHTTMRDLRSTLAYLITGNKSCKQVHAARHSEESGASLVNLMYWQSVFAPLETYEELLMDFIQVDPARFPHPNLDRFLHFHKSIRDMDKRRLLFADKIDLPPQRFKNESEWIASVKRRLYFDASKPSRSEERAGLDVPQLRWKSLLPFRHAITFLKLLDDLVDLDEVRERLALGIARSDGILGDLPPGTLNVKVSASEEQQLIVLKQFPLEDFDLQIEKPQYANLIETLPEIVVLVHKLGTPRLEITLDLFELLIQMADGLQPNAPEFQPLLEDLTLFKSTLLLQETRDLVLIENKHRVYYVTQKDGKIVRSTLEMEIEREVRA